MILILVCFLFYGNLVSAQSEQEMIDQIRKEFMEITDGVVNEVFDVQVKSFGKAEDSYDLEIYSKNDKVMHLVQSYNDGSHAAGTTSFYLLNNGLTFIYKDFGYWMFSGQDEDGNSTTIDHVVETRCYYKNGKAFRCLGKSFNSKDHPKGSGSVKNLAIECTECADLFEVLKALKY